MTETCGKLDNAHVPLKPLSCHCNCTALLNFLEPREIAGKKLWRCHGVLTATLASYGAPWRSTAFVRSSSWRLSALSSRSHGPSTACIELSRRAHCMCTALSRRPHCADGVLFCTTYKNDISISSPFFHLRHR